MSGTIIGPLYANNETIYAVLRMHRCPSLETCADEFRRYGVTKFYNLVRRGDREEARLMVECHAEIEYSGIHSDLCPPDCAWPAGGVSDEYRAFLHACLDEWLNLSHGEGVFYVGSPYTRTQLGGDG